MSELKQENKDIREYKRQVLQHALAEGLKVGCLFLLQGISLLLYRWGIISSLLFIIGFIGIPILLYRMGVQLRDNSYGGYIKYMQVVSYLSWIYIASLVVAFLSYYVSCYILFNDPNFTAMLEESLEMLQEIAQNNEQYAMAIKAIQSITPIQLAWNIILNAFVNGVIYIYIIALFIKRKPEQMM